MTKLPPDFLRLPLAHRGLHDLAAGVPENSLAAFDAAASAGYGIELDLQLSSDGQAMVFHDYDLGRLTGQPGPIRTRSAAELGRIALTGGADQTIPTLPDVLALVAGRTPLLIELKDQDGAMGPNVGVMERAVAEALESYDGPAAVMSFNPHSVAELMRLAPDLPRGLTTCDFSGTRWPTLPRTVRKRLARIPDLDDCGARFISHDCRDLKSPRVAEIKQTGMPVLCWTVRSPKQESQARKIADNITFESYFPDAGLNADRRATHQA